MSNKMICNVCGRENLTADQQNKGHDLCPVAFLQGFGINIEVGTCWKLGFVRLLTKMAELEAK